MIQISKVFERGRELALRSLHNRMGGGKAVSADVLLGKCQNLLSSKGEASGSKLASEILFLYSECTEVERRKFFANLMQNFAPDETILHSACEAYFKVPSADNFSDLSRAIESPRQEVFRRLNMAPGGTASLVTMRADLLKLLKAQPELRYVNEDFLHLFRSWFNMGFLTLEEITWSSPALVLERLIEYEAVHEIQGWDDLKNRLAPPDRHCYAFFHPSLVDEPLIFVEVALCEKTPKSVQGILDSTREILSPEQIKTAAFYSISNCQLGLRGISFGNFLIKQVAVDLKSKYPQLENFVTLSPLPGLRGWLQDPEVRAKFEILDSDWELISGENWTQDKTFVEGLQNRLLPAAITYLTDWREDNGRLRDPVARFHLGNGARIESLQWQANTSEQGLVSSLGVMVNYAYELDKVEANHEAFKTSNVIALSPAMKSLLKKTRKPS